MKILPRLLFPAIALIALSAAACGVGVQGQPPAKAPDSIHARFGMPAEATSDAGNREAFLIDRPQYVLSYNADKHIPNWVSWSLRRSDIGKSTRGPFEPDPLWPRSFAKVTSHVFDGSGFDRGHMCPAQDRSSKQEDMDATFYLSNIIPQSPACNQHAWERLESYCRDLTKKDHVLHICCGPAGVGGTGKNGLKNEIGTGMRISVPAKVWKVILVLPSEDAVPTRATRTIAVIMPNDQTVGFDWPTYRVSVNDVERLTGYTFFRNLPQDVAAALKDHVDEAAVHVPKAKFGN